MNVRAEVNAFVGECCVMFDGPNYFVDWYKAVMLISALLLVFIWCFVGYVLFVVQPRHFQICYLFHRGWYQSLPSRHFWTGFLFLSISLFVTD